MHAALFDNAIAMYFGSLQLNRQFQRMLIYEHEWAIAHAMTMWSFCSSDRTTGGPERDG
jgi:hypothetical protein